jgi:acetyl esterase
MSMKQFSVIFFSWFLFSCSSNVQENSIIQKTSVYKTIQGKQLSVDIFYTDQTLQNNDNPAIVFFHGGGWVFGSPSEFHQACKRFAKKGFITFSFEYRLSIQEDGTYPHPEITPVESVKDARSAMRWLKENADDLKIDHEKIIASGQSAGGQLALSTSLIEDINESSDNLNIDPSPVALLLYSSNVNTMEAWVDRLMGERRNEIWSISPHHNLKPGMPPVIEFHGKEDPMVPFWIVEYFMSKTIEMGNHFESVSFEGRKHYLDEGNEKYATYFDEAIMERTDQFLIDHELMPANNTE